MPQNFIESRREQGFLLPPDVREWLAADHLAWFVIDAVAEMDLDAFYGAYRADGHGRAAYEPSVMVAVILYAFATNVRSSRAIERHCRQDVAYRVITGNLVPDHATIARFICRHERALAELFGEVLGLCDRAGLVKRGVVSIDGTRLDGNCSPDANVRFEQLAREIVAQTKATDEAEDELYGEERGDEHYRATARDKLGRRLSRGPNPYVPPEVPAGRVNITDPDAKSLPISFGFALGYNAQAAVNEKQIVLAAEITNTSTDFSQLDPMVTATLNELERIGVTELPEAIVADAGYRNEQHIDEVVANKHIPVLIPPDKVSRGTPRPTWSGGRYDWMRKVLATELGRLTYRKRKQTIEPIFGHTKHNSGVTHFNRRGRVKVRTEWRLMMMTQNLAKVHRHQLLATTA
jgi:transposase